MTNNEETSAATKALYNKLLKTIAPYGLKRLAEDHHCSELAMRYRFMVLADTAIQRQQSAKRRRQQKIRKLKAGWIISDTSLIN